MDLYLFRLSLKEKRQADAFERRDRNNQDFTRETWIRDFFSIPREFFHFGAPYIFVPDPAGAKYLPRQLICGRIARAKMLPELTAPDAGLQPTVHRSWRAAVLIIDPTDHADGQKVAFEQSGDVGTALAVLRSLARAMNDQTSQERYSAEVFAIVEESSFWKFAEAHNYQKKILTLDVAVPNMFDGPEDFKDELKKLRDRNNAARVRTTLKSDGSLNTRAKNIAPIINYAEKGAGTVKARTVDGVPYNSQDHAKRVSIEVDQGEAERPDGLWATLSTKLGKIF
jgi:hypothetical protein